MWFIRGLIILVGVVAVLWLGMLNAGTRVNFQFFYRDFEGFQLNLLLLLTFVTGMVFSFLIAAISELQLRRQLSRQRRDIARLERELSALRSLPLDDAEPAEQPAEAEVDAL